MIKTGKTTAGAEEIMNYGKELKEGFTEYFENLENEIKDLQKRVSKLEKTKLKQ